MLIYTSGTTGPPKGGLHVHRVLLGPLPAIEFYHEYFPRPGDRHWSPADWAWAGGLLDVLLPSWHYGVTVVAHRPKKFDAERAFDILARHRVRNTFLVPTMLKMMRSIGNPRERWTLVLRSMFTGGEAVGEEVIRWAREALGVTPHEGFGQTEVNLVLGNCSMLMPVKPGSMGRPIPGHVVDVVNEAGGSVPIGEVGEVVVRRPDPVMFLRYWNNDRATREKFVGDWALTGDLARKDADGYFWFVGRKDDVISSGGYRIGPSEIEDCLQGHPAVALAAAIGAPDPVRGGAGKAFVQLHPGGTGKAQLRRGPPAWVRTSRSVTAIFARLGLHYVGVGGPTYCCGIVHHRNGDTAASGGMNKRTVELFQRYKPEEVVMWCPSCMFFYDEIQKFEWPFPVRHTTEFLADRLPSMEFTHRVDASC